MTSAFVVAFGGTGSRCAEAVSYLAAAGAIQQPVHILVVDPDAPNGNRRAATQQLERYQRIQKSTRSRQSFFAQPLNAELPGDSFMWGHPSPSDRFRELIGYDVLPAEAKGLLELLYDATDLDLTFERGYKGRAHIGSLDMYRTFRDAMARVKTRLRDADSTGSHVAHAGDGPLIAFFRALRGAADGTSSTRLVVVGSIFGGTGASGIPIFPTMVKEVLGPLSEKVSVGCVQLTPYFSFPPPRNEGDPDSSSHPLAARAALYHYAGNTSGYHRMYLVGAPERRTTAKENFPGGGDQFNDAHYAELAAALACADFFAEKNVGKGEGYASGRTGLTWDQLPATEPDLTRKALVAFSTFALLHSQFVAADLRHQRFHGSKFWDDLTGATGRGLDASEEGTEALLAFTSRYLDWLPQVDLSTGKALFDLSDLGESALGRLGGVPLNQRSAYDQLYALLDRGGSFDAADPLGWYLHAVSNAVQLFCGKRYGWWRKS